MLVVVHYGDVELLFQAAFYLKTFGSFDIFQVDTAESGGDGFYSLDKFVGIFFIHFDVEHVNAAIDFEQQSFAFHYGFACHCAYIAQSENGGSVGDYSHQIAFGCIFICVLRVLFYFKTWLCHARGISE